MIMTNFLQERKSVRKFKNKALNDEQLKEVREIIEELKKENAENNFDYILFENGSIISNQLRGKAGYGGVMIESPHYIAFKMRDDSEEKILKGGYSLEKLNEALIRSGVDTCWITVDQVEENVKRGLFGEDGNFVKYLIAIGIGEGKKLFTPEATSDRLRVEDLVYSTNLNEPVIIEELENLGLFKLFSSIRYAPSYKNAQPWRFLVDSPYVYLYMVRSIDDKYSLVDMGIIMYYFEQMAKTLGIQNKWEILNEPDVDGFKLIGKFHI